MANRGKKEQGIFSKFFNALTTILLAGVMFVGLQVYSASHTNLKFAHISDSHFSTAKENSSYRLTAESPMLLEDAISQINTTPGIDFVMFTGDLINKPYEKELMAFLPYANNLHAPWYAAFGNHDICTGGYLNKKLYVDILNSHNLNYNFKKPYYSFTPKKGFKAIVLDAVIDSRLTSNGELSEEQLKWLDNQLSKSKNDTVLIFLHMPVLEPLTSESHRLLNADKVNEILAKYQNPIAIFSGHYHTTKITQNGNILHVSTPSLISYPNAFRIVNINNQKNKVIFDFYFKETRLKELQKKAKLLVFASSTYYGADEDRTYTYEIKKR